MKFLIFYLFTLFFLLNISIFSYEFNIQSEYLFSDKKGKFTSAKGEVFFKSEDAEIYTHSLIVNEETKVITADGAVIFKQKDKEIEGQSLWYDYENERFYFHQPSGWIKTEGITENIYFKGKILDGTKVKITLLKGEFTTCGPQCTKEYHVQADRITIYPGDKIVARNVFYYVSKSRVFYSPLFIQSLKEKPEERKNIPQYGYNKAEGVYFKANYPYTESLALTGLFILNYMSKKGVGYGLDNNYSISNVGKGKLYFYTNKEQNTSLNTNNYNITQALQFGKSTTANITYNKNNTYSLYGPRVSNFLYNYSLQRRKASTSTTMNITRSGNIGFPPTTNSNIIHTQKLTKNINSNLTLTYSEQPFTLLGTNQELITNLSISGQKKQIPYNIIYDKRFDPDGDSYTQDDIQQSGIFRRTPEMSIQLDPSKIKNIKYIGKMIIPLIPITSFNLKFGNYTRGPIYKKSLGLEEFTAIASKNLKISDILPIKSSANLSITENFVQSFFNTGDAMYKSQLNCNLTIPLLKESKFQITYSDNKDNGGNPFGSMNVIPTQKLLSGNFLLKKHQKHQLTLTTSYNYILRIYSPLTLNYILRPNPAVNLTFSTTRNFKIPSSQSKYTPLQMNLNISKKGYNLNFASSYNIGKKSLLNTVAQCEIRRKDGIIVRSNISATKGAKQSPIKDIIIIRKRCCTQWQFIYRQQPKEYSILFNILAFPMEEVGFSSSEKGFLIYPKSPLQQLQQQQFP